MPAMTYSNADGATARAIQVSPHERNDDLLAFEPNLRYYPGAKLVYPPDSDEPVAEHPDAFFFFIAVGRSGYLNDWIVRHGDRDPVVVRDVPFRAKWSPVSGTEEHADASGPVSPTTAPLGGAMSAGEYPAMNLEDALRTEARSALQLWLNLEYLSGVSHLGGGAAPDWGYSDWPHPTEVYYRTADGVYPAKYVRLTNIKATEVTGIEWEREDVHSRVVDVAYERRYNVPAEQEQDAEYDFELDAITTRSHATSLALEDALKERLGGISHPVGLENTSKVTAAVHDQYGTEIDYKQRFADKSVLHGPIDVILRGQRARARVSQATRCIPVFEYELYLGKIEGGIGVNNEDHRYYTEVHFGSKDEFDAFVQGRGSDEAGVVYQYTARVTRDQLRTWEMAPLARQHRQTAAITDHRVPIIFSEPFDDQIQQGVLWIDAKTGKQIDPFNYHPDGGDHVAIS